MPMVCIAEMLSAVVALLGLLAAVASAADDGGLSTSPASDVPQWASDNALQLNLSASGGQSNPLQYTVIPLIQNPGLNGSEGGGIMHIDGVMIAADVSNFNKITNHNAVAYLSCDDPHSDSFITPNKMLNDLINIKPMAIVLYSITDIRCSLDNIDSLHYPNLLSMADVGEAQQALGFLNDTHNGVIKVSITGNTTAGDSGSTPSSGSKSNSAVAMSVLYSITGLITLLFLIIIATGAVRAHRYPERYGPRRALGGQSRQSRAEGLARAVLDTLPIVKFNNQQPKPDPELELETATTDGHETGPERTGSSAGSNPAADERPEAAQAAGGNGNDAPAPAADSHHQTAEARKSGGGNAGCSICTDDFTVGEDMRVLPCDHKFHPNCIDPWLVNVSGTCPLCRLDLRPEAAEAADGNASTSEYSVNERETNLPPPLFLEAEYGIGPLISHLNRVSRFFDLNRLRQATAEEQIEALRQMRSPGYQVGPEAREAEGAHEAGEAQGADGEERGQRAHLTAKLRERFRIRTRARSPEGRDC